MTPVVVETEKLHSCPNCGSEKITSWCHGRDRLHRLSDQVFHYSRCHGCGVAFMSVRPVEYEASKFYPQHYGPYHPDISLKDKPHYDKLDQVSHRPPKGVMSLIHRLLNAADYRLSKFLRDKVPGTLERYYQPNMKGQRLLDFGCGSELFLNRARDLGWHTIGIDFSTTTVERVANHGHEALLMSPDVWEGIEDESLDFVRLSHVLEHLYQPRDTLTTLRQKMKPGAILHIAVPNPQCLTARIFGSRWYALDCPRHIIVYPPKSLMKLLSELGFSGEEVMHDVITKDFARSLGYLLFDRGWIAHKNVEDMMYRPILESLLRLPARMASALSLADRYHVFVRK